MRNAIIITLIIFLASCHNYKKESERLQHKVDSLQNLTEQKDSTIDLLINDFEEIQANLDSVAKVEEMIAIHRQTVGELSQSNKQRIISDINAISGLLEENKRMITSLKQRISRSNLQTGKLESMINELEQLTQDMENKLAQKDVSINELNAQLQEQNESISELNVQIRELEAYSQAQLDSLKLQESMLNSAYFTVGPVSELKDEGVVERRGGILGIGSTPVVREDFPKGQFTQVDIRDFDYLPLNTKKADVVSVHPVDSYHISGSNETDTLFVEDPEEFWSASKYLVVVTK